MQNTTLEKNRQIQTSHYIQQSFELQEFIHLLENAKVTTKDDILQVMNGLHEDIRGANTHLTYEDEYHNHASKLINKFSLITNSLLKEENTVLPLGNWISFLSTTFLEIQHSRESKNIHLDFDLEFAVYKKFSDTSNYLSKQIQHQLQHNVITKGEFMYNYLKAGLAKTDTLIEVLDLKRKTKEAEMILQNSTKYPEHVVDEADRISYRGKQLLQLFQMHGKKTYEAKDFIENINFYLDDANNHTVFDIFSWYVEMGHPTLVNLHSLDTNMKNAAEFISKNSGKVDLVQQKYDAAVMNKNNENVLLKIDMVRKEFAKQIQALHEVDYEKYQTDIGFELQYIGDILEDIHVQFDIRHKESGVPIIGDDVVIDVRTEIFFQIMKNAKQSLENTKDHKKKKERQA